VENQPRATRPQILFAESHPALRDVLSRLLDQASHCHIAVVRNGVECVEQARLLRPDLILTGLRMPGMDGFTAINRLRTEPETAGIPIIVLSTWSDARSWERALTAGANEILILPVEIERLVAKIHKYVQY
jgi:CheY-like chemotaxis protein